MVIRSARAALAVALLFSTLSVTALVTTAAPASAGTQGIGVITPGGDAAVRSFGNKVGRTMKFAGAYLPQDSWASMIESAAGVGRSWSGDGFRMAVGVPLLPVGSTLKNGANGNYDGHWRKIGEAFVKNGLDDAVLRLGWELDGSWYRWYGFKDPAAFKSYWQRAVRQLRSVPGQNFLIDWNTTNSGKDIESLWPGDSYVDVIGVDLYDMSFGDSQKDPQDRWNQAYNKKNGLKWLSDFAKRKGKPMSLPEWGVSTRHVSGGKPDNPYFIEQVYNFVKNNNFLYFNYFEYTTHEGTYAISGGRFPNAWARYKQLFASASGTPSVAPKPAAPAPAPAPAAPTNGGTDGGTNYSGDRVTRGLQALYEFEEGSGATVKDTSGKDAIDLRIADTGKVTWTDGGLRVNSPTVISSGHGGATRLRNAIASSGAVTVELWIKPANTTQQGPARIVSMANGISDRNFFVGQGRWGSHSSKVFDARIRTSNTGVGGYENIVSKPGTATTGLTHLVFSRSSSGNAFLFINNKLAVKVPAGGNFGSWNSNFPLLLANEITGDRPWLGEFELVAFYDRYLTWAEVTKNYKAGPDAT